LQGMLMVVFADVVKPASVVEFGQSEQATLGEARLSEVAQALQEAHTELQATRDEMQTSQEELRSTNEELQSMNEELQSTNEELTTSKEESQSMNEELQTVNQEMQAKVDELSRTGNDMKNLLDSTDIAILFLDSALLVRRFTQATARIIRLIPGDIGRPITDLVSVLEYPALAADALQVLRTLVPVEKEIATRENQWFTVRVMPYRTLENRVDGAVITLTDITASKALETALRKAQSDSEARFTRQAKGVPNAGSKTTTAAGYSATKRAKTRTPSV
jgi:two-component system, chemotaxis family, CheB/CheR fusion protein